MYDLVALAIAVAFLLRYALRNGFNAAEIAGLAAAGALILIYPYVKTQVGLVAALIVMALVVQRALVLSSPAEQSEAGEGDHAKHGGGGVQQRG
jgi:hypothetical protein